MLCPLINTVNYVGVSFIKGLPDERGRVEILNIHTTKLRKHNKMDDDVDIEELAKKTRNYSGAELEGLVRSATSTAMNRIIKVWVWLKDAVN